MVDDAPNNWLVQLPLGIRAAVSKLFVFSDSSLSSLLVDTSSVASTVASRESFPLSCVGGNSSRLCVHFFLRCEEIAQLSMEEAPRFQALFAQQAEKSKDMEERTLSILCMEEEAHERDSVLLDRKGNSSDQGWVLVKKKEKRMFSQTILQF